ncbi:MAG: 2-C-methyl-D-erythritol 4-phosphate cytidylyltransferase [Pseudomonadota bacterium]|nr:2-C-methyl-D-erythritol 4-phosphate cytidylyltransferase [Pseudomonadota bacterium]
MQIGISPCCYALVPCAGIGQRAGAGGPKQYRVIAGAAMVVHTLRALLAVPRLAAVLVVLSPEDEGFEAAAGELLDDPRLWVARCGGASRAESVAGGLQALADRGVAPHDWVLVHDAARCLVAPAWVDRLIDACADDEVGGLLALPVADTLKQQIGAGPQARVAATVDRAGKWAAQTPQMFRRGLLQPALRQADERITDESSAIEALGHAPRLVRGDLLNLKVTWPEDFVLAERLLGGN